jgi:cytochrome c peroxidase
MGARSGQRAWRSLAAAAGALALALACPGAASAWLTDTFVPKRTPSDTDPGAKVAPGAFNTPQMRDLRNTAPYMHKSVFGTLREVVEFYDQRSSVAPLRLTQAEINDLVAFLEEL